MKKAAKKKRSTGRAVKVKKAVPRKSSASASRKRPAVRKSATRPAQRVTSRGSRGSSASAKKRRGPENAAGELARSALEAFDAGRLDKARRDILALSEMLSEGP